MSSSSSPYKQHSLQSLITPPVKQTPEITQSLAEFKRDLQERGWAFLKNDIPTLFSSKYIAQLFSSVEKFANRPKSEKDSFRISEWPENRFGYFATPRKEGYRYISGAVMDKVFSNRFPAELKEWQKVSKAMDSLCYMIFKENGSYLFNLSPFSGNGTQYVQTMPLLKPLVSQETAKHPSPIRHKGFGLFDTVVYHPVSKYPPGMDTSKIPDLKIQVEPHSDPGLFSISLGSSIDNMLEMEDPKSKTWVPVPANCMVFWCGKIASIMTGDAIKPGVHRVKANQNQSRVSAWFEVCIDGQIPEESWATINSWAKAEHPFGAEKLGLQTSVSKELPSSFEIHSGIPVQKAGMPSPFTFDPFPSSSNRNVVNNISNGPWSGGEYATGIPVGKSMPPLPEELRRSPKKFPEHFSGIPMSKSYVPPSLRQPQQPKIPAIPVLSEFDLGVPMSKAYTPPAQQPSSFNVINNTQPSKKKKSLNEFNTGIPTSKRL